MDGRLSARHGIGDIAAEGTGQTPDGATVGVMLWVREGELSGLEIYPTVWPVVSPRALEEGENVIITVSYPDQGWERIAARKLDGLAFAHGLAAGGTGCSSPRCDDVFAFKRWSDGKAQAQ